MGDGATLASDTVARSAELLLAGVAVEMGAVAARSTVAVAAFAAGVEAVSGVAALAVAGVAFAFANVPLPAAGTAGALLAAAF